MAIMALSHKLFGRLVMITGHDEDDDDGKKREI